MTLISYFVLFTLVFTISSGKPATIIKDPRIGLEIPDDVEIVMPSEILKTEKSTKQSPANFVTKNKITSSFQSSEEKERKLIPDKSVNDYDYYDYANDPSYISKVGPNLSELRSTTSPPSSQGCPQTHSVCQFYCESLKFYSGYCEGDLCRCYGKL